VRMVGEIRADHESDRAAMNKVAELLGIGSGETVRKWVRQNAIDAGVREGVTTKDSEEVGKLRREVAELKRAGAILNVRRLSSRQCHSDLCPIGVRSFLRCLGSARLAICWVWSVGSVACPRCAASVGCPGRCGRVA